LRESLVDATFILKNENPIADELAKKGLDGTSELVQVLINYAIWQMYLCWQGIELIEDKGYFRHQMIANRLQNYSIGESSSFISILSA